MIETDILKALQTAGIEAIAATVTAPAEPLLIKVIDRILEPTPLRYFEFVHIPNNRQGDFFGDERTYQGVFRILLHWTIDDEGGYPPRMLLDKVANYFPKGKHLISGPADVQIYGEPDLGGTFPSGSELIFPLSLRYRCVSP